MPPFGSEYAFRPCWSPLQRAYIRLFGIIDLPTRIRARVVTPVLDRLAGDSVLDVGAGTGVYAYYASRASSRRVVALDIDRARIEDIKYVVKRIGRRGLSTVCGDEKRLADLPKDEFSFVLAIEVLTYLPDLQGALRSLNACMRPGGAIVAHVPMRAALLPFEHTLLSDDLLRSQFRAAGFESLEIHQTFGRAALALCDIFDWCVQKPVLLAIMYPLLLLASKLTPAIVEAGCYRLVIAKKPSAAAPE
jgi:SAM-dependent methyltransferase